MSRYFCVFDFETINRVDETPKVNPTTCLPIEVACIMLDPYNLEIVEGSEFNSLIKPKGITGEQFYEKYKESLDWHANNRQTTADEIITQLKKAPSLDVIWPTFSKHIDKYNKDNTQWNAPIPAGMNIVNFDLVIAERLNADFKVNKMFNHEVVDLRHLAFYWLCWNTKLRSRSMDNLRKYFGMSGEHAHEALGDVKQEAEAISRFLKFHKAMGAKYNYFEGAFAE